MKLQAWDHLGSGATPGLKLAVLDAAKELGYELMHMAYIAQMGRQFTSPSSTPTAFPRDDGSFAIGLSSGGGRVLSYTQFMQLLRETKQKEKPVDRKLACYTCKDEAEGNILREVAKATEEGVVQWSGDHCRYNVEQLDGRTVFTLLSSQPHYGFVNPEAPVVEARREVASLQDMIKAMMGQPFKLKEPDKTWSIGCHTVRWLKDKPVLSAVASSASTGIEADKILEIISEGQRLGYLPSEVIYQKEEE